MGKTFFSRLAPDAIREFNMVRDKYCVSFARKAMLQCGLGLKKGVWKNFAIEAGASRNNSQDRSHFDGEPVPSLGADVEIVVVMNKSRMLSIL